MILHSCILLPSTSIRILIFSKKKSKGIYLSFQNYIFSHGQKNKHFQYLQ